ncbi:MAG: tRNA (N(6)-L-threonylcarbamoyladenosine(37)-C(2))-methylthiotransferase MtaB [Elusimicrobiota bacterium]
MRIYCKTFGCRVNQYETEAVSARLLADGASRAVADYEDADLCVINTCTVTRAADKDALQIIRRIARRNPAARLVVTGCLASRDREEIRKISPAALIVGNKEKKDIPALLGCRSVPHEAGLKIFSKHSRAFVKVQDGCNMRCAYCIVPTVRPQLTSRPPAQVAEEFRTLIGNGYRELVLCGVRLGRYKAEDKTDFVGLLERLAALPGDFRIRLSSLEITDITARLLRVIAGSAGRICPSFHLPLQSGSDRILKRMKRWYATEPFARRIAALRARIPDAGIFTDVMVGFPGETRKDFQASLRFVERTGFSGLHVFRYSRRGGTPAAEFADQVDDRELLARAAGMRALDKKLRAAFAAAAAGSRRRIIVEEKGARAQGLTDHFLRVGLDRNPGPGLYWARIGGGARAKIELSVPGEFATRTAAAK